MSGSVNVNHGSISKLRGSVTFPNFPSLNVTAPFLTRDGIVMSFTGNSTELLDVMTGRIRSPELYVGGEFVVHLVKSMSLAAAFQTQFLTLTGLGPATVRPDTPPATGITSWQVLDTTILSVGEQSYAGSSADFPVRIGGYILVNASLFT